MAGALSRKKDSGVVFPFNTILIDSVLKYSSSVQGLLDVSAATCVFYVGDLSFAA